MFFFAVILFLLYAFRLWLAGFAGLHPDEAYYWTWAQHLSLGYFDHPPMVAWIIRAGEELQKFVLPNAVIARDPLFYSRTGLKLMPYFLTSVVTPLLMARATEVAQRQPLRLSQMGVLLSLPLFVLGPQIVTPDAPFFTGWAAILLVSLHTLRSRSRNAMPGDITPFSWKRSVAAGVALAFCAYSKYSAVLAAFLFVLTGAGIFNAVVACVVAALLTTPYFAWTWTVARPEGAGIFFQFGNALGAPGAGVNYKRLGDLLASQLFLWGPPVFVGSLLAPLIDFRRLFIKQKRSLLVGSLFLWAFLPVAFFALNALKRPAEANWPLVGALAATVLVLARLRNHITWMMGTFLLNVMLCLSVAIFLTQAQLFVPLAESFSPRLAEKLKQPSRLQEFQRWERLHEVVFEATRLEQVPVEVQSYQVLSEMLFADAATRSTERFGDRLKIWPAGSRMSEFQRHARYLNANPQAPHWLLTRNVDKTPERCLLQQTIFKSPGEVEPFSIYRCNF